MNLLAAILLLCSDLAASAAVRSPRHTAEPASSAMLTRTVRQQRLAPDPHDPARLEIAPSLSELAEFAISEDTRAAAIAPPTMFRWKLTWDHRYSFPDAVTFNIWGSADLQKVRHVLLTNVPGTARSVDLETASPAFFFTASTQYNP